MDDEIKYTRPKYLLLTVTDIGPYGKYGDYIVTATNAIGASVSWIETGRTPSVKVGDTFKVLFKWEGVDE